MSSKVKERLKQLMIEITHEERIMLDELLDKIAIEQGIILVTDESNHERGCDVLIEEIPDDKLRELVRRIKKKKKVGIIA